jgi:hypothetical protein
MGSINTLYKRFRELEYKHNIWDNFNKLREEFGKDGQSYKSASGGLFERVVKEKINSRLQLECIPIEIIPGKILKLEYKNIYDYIVREYPRACSQQKVVLFPDSDLVAISKQTQDCIAFLSCKTSFRERAIPQIIMWQDVVARPFHVVTLDLGDGKGKTELGTCKKPSKSRKIAECLLKGNIYVPEDRPNIDFCVKVRKLEQLPQDLKDELLSLTNSRPKKSILSSKTRSPDDWWKQYAPSKKRK